MKKLIINGFTYHRCSRRTMHYGKLFDRVIYIPGAKKRFAKRYCRIWVPDNFDPNEKIGVLYMSDGQNAVDHNLTAYGEWDMEDHFHVLEEKGYPRFIIVGIDCPHNGLARARELTPYPSTRGRWKRMNPVYGDQFSDYIVNEIAPMVNELFNVDYDRVGFCGSSMGGLFSFHICAKYPEIFRFCLTFSPCFECFKDPDLYEHLDNYHLENALNNRWVFYMGGADPLERTLTRGCEKVIEKMYSLGYNDDNLLYIKDESKIHHETAWSEVAEPALEYVLR